jgi:hypothetical protein
MIEKWDEYFVVKIKRQSDEIKYEDTHMAKRAELDRWLTEHVSARKMNDTDYHLFSSEYIGTAYYAYEGHVWIAKFDSFHDALAFELRWG